MALKYLIVAALAIFFTASVLADHEQDVRCREIAFSQSAEQRDAVRFVSFIDSDARFVGATVLRGPDEISEGWSAFLSEDGPAIKWRPQVIEVLEDGTLALSRGPYRVTATDEDGAASEHWGTFNSVWRKQPDGAWRIIFDAGSPAAGPPADDVRALLDEELDCPR